MGAHGMTVGVPPRRRGAQSHRVVVVLAALAVAASACGPSTTGAEGRRSGTRPDRVAPTTWWRPPGTTATTTAPAPPTTAPPAPTTTATPAGPALVVTHVVDGDTLWVTGNVKVRLIGIDTPERGQCGYVEAGATLRSLVDGRAVTLVPGARDDSDRYGRLLRYVEVDGVDANLAMITSGRAIARYDSRDGYGRHARQDAYVAADAASPSANVCGPADPAPAAPPAPPPAPATTLVPAAPDPGAGTDPRFRTCGEAIANGYGPYTSGVDPEYDWYRDADGDGTVCE